MKKGISKAELDLKVTRTIAKAISNVKKAKKTPTLKPKKK